jgi:hypothetical protein
MDQGVGSISAGENAQDRAHQDPYRLYAAALRARPIGVGLGLGIEYLTFAAGLFLALLLFLTRVPMRIIDRTFGLRLREHCVNALARISPG